MCKCEPQQTSTQQRINSDFNDILNLNSYFTEMIHYLTFVFFQWVLLKHIVNVDFSWYFEDFITPPQAESTPEPTPEPEPAEPQSPGEVVQAAAVSPEAQGSP